MTVEEVPWARIPHWYGRASNIPTEMRRLASADIQEHESACENLARCLEHQDGVCLATPLAVHFILKDVERGRMPLTPALIEFFNILVSALHFQLSGEREFNRDVTLNLALNPAVWMPEKADEEGDEIWFEESNESRDDFKAWQYLTAREIVASKAVFHRYPEFVERLDGLKELL